MFLLSLFFGQDICVTDPKVLQELLESACSNLVMPGALRFKPMFGGITGYVGDRNFASLSDVGLAFKLAPADIGQLVALGGEMLQYEPNAPVSKTSVVVPPAILGDQERLSEWAFRSAEHVMTLPEPRKRK